MSKAIQSSDQGEQTIIQFELPARVEASLPDNAVTLESLCNGPDIVLRGTGRPFETNKGLATPVYFQLLDHYQQHGPTPLDMAYLENGDAYLTGRSAVNGAEYPPGVYQFLTSSVVILRAARKLSDQNVGSNEKGLLCAVQTRRAVASGNDYYVLV